MHRHVKELKTSKGFAREGKVSVRCGDCGHEFDFQQDGGQTLHPTSKLNTYEIVNDDGVI